MSDIDEMLGSYLDRHSKNIFKTKDWNQVIKVAKENKAQTKTAIYQALVAKTDSGVKDTDYTELTAYNRGYNAALDEVNKILREYFGVSE